jgi:hypothetical protein
MLDARAPTPLTTPLQCWHESIHSARHDLIVALSEHQARIATNRPLPIGTAVFVEFAGGAGVDAITTEADDNGFVVEFIAVDDAVAAVLAAARTPMGSLVPPAQQRRIPSLSMTPQAAAFLSDEDEEDQATPASISSGPPRVDVELGDEAPLPRTRTDRQFLNATPPGSEADVDQAARSPSPASVDDTRATNDANNASNAMAALSSSQPTSGSDALRSSFDLPPTRDFIDRQDERPASSPTWSRSLSMVLGDDAPSPTDQTQRWPIATVAESVAEATRSAPPTPAPSAKLSTSVPLLALNFAGSDDEPKEQTQRWPVAHAKRQDHLRPPAATVLSPYAVALADNGFDVDLDDIDGDGTDGHGSSTDGLSTAAAVARGSSRPTSTPASNDGVIDVDFSEFADVLGVATFASERSHPGRRIELGTDMGASVAPNPTSAAPPHAPVASPPPPTPMLPKPIDELWVVSPRLIENEFDSMLRDMRPIPPKPVPASASGPRVPPANAVGGEGSHDQDGHKNSTR